MKSGLNKYLFGFIHIALSIMIALIVLYAAVSLGSKAFSFGYRVFTEEAVSEAPGQDVGVTVSEGMTASELGNMLEEKGLIKDADLFTAQMALSIYSMQEKSGKKQILPGTYVLNTSMTSKEMMSLMATEPEESTESADTAGEEEITVSSEE